MHVYQDISHFRAPYKSLRSVAGFGEDVAAAAAAPGPSTGITMETINAVTIVGADGVRRYRPDVAAFALELLKSWSATQLSNLLVKVEPFAQALLDAAKAGDQGAKNTIALANARTWIDTRVAGGHAVFLPYAVLWPTPQALAAGIQCFATPATDKQTMKAAGSMFLGAYAIEPATAGAVTGAGPTSEWVKPVLIAGGVAVGLGLAVWGFKRFAKPRRVLGGSLGKS